MSVTLKVNNPSPQTASEQLVAQAAASIDLTFDHDRKLTICKPSVLAQFRMVEALGPERSKNATLVNMYLPLVYLSHVDGEPVSFPHNPLEVDAILQAIGDVGLVALLTGVEKHFGQQDPEADRLKLKK